MACLVQCLASLQYKQTDDAVMELFLDLWMSEDSRRQTIEDPSQRLKALQAFFPQLSRAARKRKTKS